MTATEPTPTKLTITEPGLYDDISDVDYHADPIPAGSLSSTFARLLTQYVPARAVEERNRQPSAAMNLGTAAHLHLLGTGPELIVWEHDGRTKAGKAERAAAAPQLEAQTAIAVSEAQREQIVGMREALYAHPELAEVLDTARTEVSAFWQAGDVWCRARYDLLGDRAYDYKTSDDCSRRGFSKSMARYGYHQQADHYERGLAALGHPAAGKPLRFIAQETAPPYLVQIHEPDEEARELARILNDRAVALYADCMASGRWPGYPTLVAEPASLPSFYFFENAEVLPDQWRPSEQEMVIP